METSRRRFAICLLFLLSVTMSSEVDRQAMEAIAKGNMAFTANLYKILREKSGNLFFSPISIEVILALVHMGARGRTAEQMATALHLPADKSAIESGFKALMENLKSTDNMVLEIANKVFGQQSYPIEADFKAIAEKSFLSAAQEMDFIKDSEGSRAAINKWVEERTRNKITNLIPPGLIDPLTRLVLVNAIYFKGKWKAPFNPDQTRKEPFYVSATETKQVNMMHLKKKFGYSERDDLQAKVLAMPYVGEQISMVVLLPYVNDGLAQLEDKLDKIDMADLLQTMSYHTEVEVSLPSFKLEESIDLNEPLMKLGMTDMFEGSLADFSGITKSPEGLVVSKVLQKAFIEVNEEGSEAAAATAVQVMTLSAFDSGPEFRANHPFVFYVVYKTRRVVLFAGRLCQSSMSW